MKLRWKIFIGMVACAFLLFVCPSLIAAFYGGNLLDVDHVWKWFLHVPDPLSFTGIEGRPFHSPFIFVLGSIACSRIIVAFIHGFITYTRFRDRLVALGFDDLQIKPMVEKANSKQISKTKTSLYENTEGYHKSSDLQHAQQSKLKVSPA